MGKLITQKQIKNEVIKIIKKSKIEEIIYEPSYYDIINNKYVIGSIITIKTSFPKRKK